MDQHEAVGPNDTLLDTVLAWANRHRDAIEQDTQDGKAALDEMANNLARAYLGEELEDALFTFREATDLTDGRAKHVAVALLTAAVEAAPTDDEMMG
jgi:hypothetical protein